MNILFSFISIILTMKVKDALSYPITRSLGVIEAVAAWENYAQAMERRRPGTALELNNFLYHVGHHADLLVETKTGGKVFGSYQDGVFYPSHFAPANLRDGVELIRLLAREDTILAVPEDLARQAERLGFTRASLKLPMHFRGSECTKVVLYSSKAALKGAALSLTDAVEIASERTDEPSLGEVLQYWGTSVKQGPHYDFHWKEIGAAQDLLEEQLQEEAIVEAYLQGGFADPIRLGEWA